MSTRAAPGEISLAGFCPGPRTVGRAGWGSRRAGRAWPASVEAAGSSSSPASVATTRGRRPRQRTACAAISRTAWRRVTGSGSAARSRARTSSRSALQLLPRRLELVRGIGMAMRSASAAVAAAVGGRVLGGAVSIWDSGLCWTRLFCKNFDAIVLVVATLAMDILLPLRLLDADKVGDVEAFLGISTRRLGVFCSGVDARVLSPDLKCLTCGEDAPDWTGDLFGICGVAVPEVTGDLRTIWCGAMSELTDDFREACGDVVPEPFGDFREICGVVFPETTGDFREEFFMAVFTYFDLS